jgi:hypothetical protein
MRRVVIAIVLALVLAFAPLVAEAADNSEDQTFGLSGGQLAIAVAFVVTTARVAFVMIAGGTVLGRSLSGALLGVYLAHVVAEGVIYGAGAGASAYVLSNAKADAESGGESPPAILPERLGSEPPPRQSLPLQTAKPRLP